MTQQLCQGSQSRHELLLHANEDSVRDTRDRSGFLFWNVSSYSNLSEVPGMPRDVLLRPEGASNYRLLSRVASQDNYIALRLAETTILRFSCPRRPLEVCLPKFILFRLRQCSAIVETFSMKMREPKGASRRGEKSSPKDRRTRTKRFAMLLQLAILQINDLGCKGIFTAATRFHSSRCFL